MDLLVGFLIFAGIFALFDALRKVDNNILNQTEEIKKQLTGALIQEVLTPL